MEHDVTPFWTDIKKYEETLVKDPGSYCFVPLAELYRKMGLFDDAIHVAKTGCELHPDYVGGYMALGRAYFDKGLKEESRGALEKVIGFTPDNLLARRILSQIYAENGDVPAAEESLRYVLSQNPADNECQMLLDSLTSGTPLGAHPAGDAADRSAHNDHASYTTVLDLSAEEGEIIEDAEILEDFDEEEQTFVIDEAADRADQVVTGNSGRPTAGLPDEYDEFFFTPPDEVFSETGGDVTPEETAGDAESIHAVPGEAFTEPKEDDAAEENDPLVTATMAELYVSQGFLKRALTIYRELLDDDPDNEEWKNRLYDLKMAIDEDTAVARNVAAEEIAQEPAPSAVPVLHSEPGETAEPTIQGEAVLATLEKWLDTARRRH